MRWPAASWSADLCGRREPLTESVVKLSEVFLTRIPLAATTGSAIAATSTPPSTAMRIRRPTEFVLLAVQFKSCTRHSVRGRARYYWHQGRRLGQYAAAFVTRGTRVTGE